VGCTETVTLTVCKVIPADPWSPGFTWLIAPTVTLAGLGITAGAVYSPVPVTVSEIAFPFATPFTSHSTVVSVEPVTVA
jgi:hypothetical protein